MGSRQKTNEERERAQRGMERKQSKEIEGYGKERRYAGSTRDEGTVGEKVQKKGNEATKQKKTRETRRPATPLLPSITVDTTPCSLQGSPDLPSKTSSAGAAVDLPNLPLLAPPNPARTCSLLAAEAKRSTSPPPSSSPFQPLLPARSRNPWLHSRCC